MVRCSQCQKELTLITGHATIRLYRCGGCGTQQLLPGDPTGAVAQPAAVAAPEVADPIGAAAALIAANPPQPKRSPKMIFVAVAIALGLLLLVLAS